MPLCLEKLENVREQGGKTTARCPACAEEGHDRAGNHLVVGRDGRFSCVVHPGLAGKEHRRRIVRLTGVRSKPKPIAVRPAARQSNALPILGGVLGRLGRLRQTLTYSHFEMDIRKECKTSVPSVPRSGTVLDDFKIGVPSVPRMQAPARRRARYAATYPERLEAGTLLRWLQNADLPASFSLYPWAFVLDAAKYRASLIADLSGPPTHARFRPALSEARKLQQLAQTQ